MVKSVCKRAAHLKGGEEHWGTLGKEKGPYQNGKCKRKREEKTFVAGE